MYKTRARDSEIRKYIRHYADGVIRDTEDAKAKSWLSEVGKGLCRVGLAASWSLGESYARTVADHLVLEHEFAYGDTNRDTIVRLSWEEREKLWSVQRELAATTAGVAALDEYEAAHPPSH